MRNKYLDEIMIEKRRGKWEIKPSWTEPTSMGILFKNCSLFCFVFYDERDVIFTDLIF